MSRFLILVLLSLSLLDPAAVVAQCNQTQRYSSQYRSTAGDVAVDGDDLFVATTYGVELHRGGSVISSLAINGATNAVTATPTVVYAGSGSEIVVIRRTGSMLSPVRSVAAPGAVSDLLYVAPYLFAATSKGVAQFDLLNVESPVLVRTLSTTSGSASALARLDRTLYAADGDSTIEAYSIAVPSLPQKIGTFPSLPRSSSVHVSGVRIFVSDGAQTEIFAGDGAQVTRLASLPGIGATSLFPGKGTIVWMSGSDRRLRAVDLADPAAPVVVFETATPVTGGSVNRIVSITGVEGKLFVSAGDAGLRTFDVSSFSAPYAFRLIPGSPLRSIVATGSVVYASLEDGGIARTVIGAGTPSTSVFDSSTIQTVADVSAERLVSFAGSTVTVWNITSATPSVAGRATFGAAVVDAVTTGLSTVVAVLGDGSLVRADVGSSPAQIVPVQIAGARFSSIARNGNRIATAQITAEGSSVLRLHSDDLGVAREFPLEGAATGGVAVAVDGSLAASTFRGVSVIDASGQQRILEGSSNILARDLEFRGSRLYVTGRDQIAVWDVVSGRRTASLASTGDASSLAITSDGLVTVATSSGLLVVDDARITTLPFDSSSPPANRFYSKMAFRGNDLFVVDGRRIDRYRSTSTSLASQGSVTISDAIVDIAAAGSRVAVLTSNGKVSLIEGSSIVRETTINEGDDVILQSIHAHGNAIYVALSRGCLSGGCSAKTLVYDAATLAMQPSLDGSLRELSVAGARGYAVFGLAPQSVGAPDAEMRIVDLSDPLRPSTIRNRAIERSEAIVSIASIGGGRVAAIGQRLYLFDEATLTKTNEYLDAFAADPAGRLSFLDQRVRVVGSCLAVIGRTHDPLLFTVQSNGTLAAAGSFRGAAAVREAEVSEGTFHFLSDYSIDVWSNLITPPAARRRSGRR